MTMWLPQPCPKELLLEIPIFCRVHSLERPRINYHSKSIYTPMENQKQLIAEMKTHKQTRSLHEPLFVEIIICLLSPTDALDTPAINHDLGDIDNQAKAVLDAMVKALIIVDDKQVVALHVSRAYDVEDFCLIRLWSVEEKREVNAWDSSTARTSLTPAPLASTPSNEKPRPSRSSRPAAAKRRS